MPLFVIAALTAAAAPAPDPILQRMLALYDTVCLQAFPNDKAVDGLMTKTATRALTLEEIKVTLRDDPGRGWIVDDGDEHMQVMLELPPYHACSVRRMTASGFADLGAYEALSARFRSNHPGFAPTPPYEADVGDLHVHATGMLRPLAKGQAETLYVFDQHIKDPERRAKGESKINMRFVHQIVDADAH